MVFRCGQRYSAAAILSEVLEIIPIFADVTNGLFEFLSKGE